MLYYARSRKQLSNRCYEADCRCHFKKLNIKYEDKNKTKINLIADHLRALVFVIGEGCIPSNEGRGYVLRRLLRRALKTANDFGYKNAFLNEITYSVINVYGCIYDNLPKEENNIKRILKEEENKFINTISAGINKLYSVMEDSKDKIIKGSDAFMLFDTYGLPLDITEEEASEHGFTIDKEGFEEAMESQRKRSRGIDSDKNLNSIILKIVKLNIREKITILL